MKVLDNSACKYNSYTITQIRGHWNKYLFFEEIIMINYKWHLRSFKKKTIYKNQENADLSKNSSVNIRIKKPQVDVNHNGNS